MSIDRSSQPAKRVRRSPQAARENILVAAQAILTERGPHDLKLKELAGRAGVSNASVLHYFGSIAGIQAALMERMLDRLRATIMGIAPGDMERTQIAALDFHALFDAFEERGTARLASWLEMTGEGRRLTMVKEAVREVVRTRMAPRMALPEEALEDFVLVAACTALGVGLFGPAFEALLGRPAGQVRNTAIAMFLTLVQIAPQKEPD